MALNELKKSLEYVLERMMKKYDLLSLEELENESAEISADEEVNLVRMEFAQYMDNGKVALENIITLCKGELINTYKKTGKRIDHKEHDEVSIVCEEHAITRMLAKCLLPENIEMKDAEFNYANLIYSHYQETIENGRILCDDLRCRKPGKISGVATTIMLRQKVDKEEIMREIAKELTAKVNEMTNGTTSTYTINTSSTRKSIDLRAKYLGFENSYDMLEATKAFEVNMADIFPKNEFGLMMAPLLRDMARKYIPTPIMSITLGEKMSDSLPNKFIMHKYKGRAIHDLCRARFVTYGDERTPFDYSPGPSCIDIINIFEEKERLGMISLVLDEEAMQMPSPERYLVVRDTGYRAYHMDIIPWNTGMVAEIQIKTNEEDTKSVLDPKQAHKDRRENQKKNIDEMIMTGEISAKEVYLTRLILKPSEIQEYRA